jgi:transforming growth factor-beta-induced protein
MKKLFAVLAVFALAATSVQAHCGSCGVGDDHSKAEKAGVKMEEMKKMTIGQTAAKNGEFTILLKAVKAAGLESALNGAGPLTVFAPTDKAFEALPEGTLEKLLKDKEKLTSVLTYHIINSKLSSKQVVKMDKARTVNGQEFKIVKNDKGLMVDDASVVTTDIECSNGVIHVIDKVILPKEKG